MKRVGGVRLWFLAIDSLVLQHHGPLVIDLPTCLPPLSLPLCSPSTPSSLAYSLAASHPPPMLFFLRVPLSDVNCLVSPRAPPSLQSPSLSCASLLPTLPFIPSSLPLQLLHSDFNSILQSSIPKFLFLHPLISSFYHLPLPTLLPLILSFLSLSLIFSLILPHLWTALSPSNNAPPISPPPLFLFPLFLLLYALFLLPLSYLPLLILVHPGRSSLLVSMSHCPSFLPLRWYWALAWIHTGWVGSPCWSLL